MASMESILGRNKQEKRFLQMFGEDVLEGGPKRKHNSGVVFKDKQFDQRGEMRKKKSLLLDLTISSLKMHRLVEFLFEP